MAPPKTEQCSSIEKCKSVFVSWIAAFGLLIGGLSGAVGYVSYSSTKDTSAVYELKIMRDKVETHDIRIAKLEKISADLDSIKLWVRR